jgi:HD-GYP domain-containing protein (c-di-GMP phosphodiesterase class II)
LYTATTVSSDAIPALKNAGSFSEQLKRVHTHIQRQYPFISCIDVALHHAASNSLKLYTASCSISIGAFVKNAFRTDANSSMQNQKLQVIDDLGQIGADETEIRNYIQASGFKSGLRVPFNVDDQLCGFTFFTAHEKHCFTPEIMQQMQVYAKVITQLVDSEDRTAQDLNSAVSAILRLNNVNQSESPQHLKRVAHYSRLIATNCADTHSLSEEWIEHLYLFAPLHDIGKVFMPEDLLMKPGPLSPQEFERMKTHTLKGQDMIDHVIDSFGYKDHLHYTSMLRNIVTHHHETIDGKGYPYGLKGDEIPLEAKIVAVADILDAMLTKRAYKEAWSIDKTLAELRKLSGAKLDPEFIGILASHQQELVKIRTDCAE